MARVGVFTVVFISPGALPGEVAEADAVHDGGRDTPPRPRNVAQGICDRLVAAACAHEVAGRHDVVARRHRRRCVGRGPHSAEPGRGRDADGEPGAAAGAAMRCATSYRPG